MSESQNQEMNFDEFKAEENAFSNIDHVIGIVSGKGGVGKSTVTAALANALAVQGCRVGILDADITGPSIPRMYGIQGAPAMDENGIYPPEAANGIEIMSTNLLLSNEEEPVVWRGPVIAGMVKQFWSDVVWGQLDYMLVDMPPGTGDVPLTVFQSLPIEGVIVVTSPQDLVKMIVAKAVHMAEMMQVPVLGLIENYSFLRCPHCGEELHPFGESRIDEVAQAMSLPVLGRISMDTAYAAAADEGRFAEVLIDELDAASVHLRSLS